MALGSFSIMQKKFQITSEEFDAIKEAITQTLDLWAYDFIEANCEDGRSMGMSKETFFKKLEKQFIVI